MSDPAPRPRFPIARRAWRFAKAARLNWLTRHRNGASFALHMVGIPLAFAGLLSFPFLDWRWGVGALVSGYFLQWVGHRIEGNDVGEMIPIKRALGLRVIEVAPRFAPADGVSNDTK